MAKKDESKSKVDMVRDAIEKLGWEAGLEAYHQFVLDTYKVDMSKPHISQTLSNERKRHGIRSRRGRKKRARSEAAPAAGPASVSDIVSFVNMIKEWEEKIGADSIREVVKSALRK